MTKPNDCGEQGRKTVFRGKSEHRRAECRVTPGEGDFKESATEIYRPVFRVRVERRGKSSPSVLET